MKLTEQNYFSKEANKEYLSVSQIKSFIGTPFMQGCEARALAEIKGEYEREKSDSLLIGSYFDEMLTGTEESLKQFIENTPQMFYANGSGKLLAKFQQAVDMANIAKADKQFMRALTGKHQVILTGDLFGVPTKVKLDVLRDNSIVDLKSCESIRKGYYDAEKRKYISFVEYQNYILQGAVYTHIAKQNYKKDYKFVLACISKEKVPDKELIEIDAETMHDELFGNTDMGKASLEETVKHIDALKKGHIEAIPCGVCDYCKSKKKITRVINWQDLLGEVEQ